MAVEKISVKNAAERLGISPRTVYRWIGGGRLVGDRAQGKIMVDFEVAPPPSDPVPLAREEEPLIAGLSAVTTAILPEASCAPPSKSSSPQRDLVFNWRSYYRVAF